MSRYGRLARLRGMNPITVLADSRLRAFEREWNYDASYLRAIFASGIGAVRALLGIERISRYRKGIPLAPWFAAKIVAARAEDCGPCVQLVVTMAERAGPAPTRCATRSSSAGEATPSCRWRTRS